MITIYHIAALAAAFSWASGSLASAIAVRHMGTLAFNRYRLTIATIILLSIMLVTGSWRGFDLGLTSTILVSGFIGIFMGDTALFGAVRRLGIRRAQILFAMNAPLTALLGAIFLGEKLSAKVYIGIVVVMIGVTLAIIFGKKRDQISHWEEITPPLWIGVGIWILAALGQAIGSLIIRPVMEAGADPFSVAMIRIAISALAFWLVATALPSSTRIEKPMTKKIGLYLFFSTIFGMVIGMTLIMYALTGANAGVVATLSSTTPVLMLPLLWMSSKQMPPAPAWFGAILVLIGSGLIFSG